jgi:hypothetical protein
MERLEALVEFSRTASQPYYYFDAELWQRAPEQLLPKLTNWLELDSPLSENYQVFSQTGKARKGDTSARIHRGSIDRTPVDYSHVLVPEALLDKAREVYWECRWRIFEKAVDSLRVG